MGRFETQMGDLFISTEGGETTGVYVNEDPYPVFVIPADITEALRKHFRAERDEKIGRWRDTVNPNAVVYRKVSWEDDVVGRYISIFDEAEGSTLGEYWENDGPSRISDIAERYFAAHSEPKPWLSAECGELWMLRIDGRAGVYLMDESGIFREVFTEKPVNSLEEKAITAGRRIWPEGGDPCDD